MPVRVPYLPFFARTTSAFLPTFAFPAPLKRPELRPYAARAFASRACPLSSMGYRPLGNTRICRRIKYDPAWELLRNHKQSQRFRAIRYAACHGAAATIYV